MKKAFTLIELLVVIAIIAILAAILFPVFAQAKAAAKKTQSLSNTKQLGTGLMIYSNDADDTAPYAMPKQAPDGTFEGGNISWWGGATWVFKAQPYIKNLAIFQAPGESAMTGGTWQRPTLSYQINAYVDGYWEGKHGAVAIGGDWGHMGNPTLGSIGRSAETVLLAERHDRDYTANWIRVFGPGSGDRGHAIQGTAPFAGVEWMDGWLGPSAVPDGAQPANRDWPNGRRGTMSEAWNGISNVVFVDSHAKGMRPVQTNPDKWGQPDKNMWDGSRQ